MIDSLIGKLSKNTLKNASNSEVIVHHREFWNIPSSQGASWPHRESSIMPSRRVDLEPPDACRSTCLIDSSKIESECISCWCTDQDSVLMMNYSQLYLGRIYCAIFQFHLCDASCCLWTSSSCRLSNSGYAGVESDDTLWYRIVECRKQLFPLHLSHLVRPVTVINQCISSSSLICILLL